MIQHSDKFIGKFNDDKSVMLDGTDKKSIISAKDVTGYYGAGFSPKCDYYTLNYQGPGAPWSSVFSTLDISFESALYDGSYEKQILKNYAFPSTKFITIKNDNGDEMNARMITPADFDDSGDKKYPVFFEVYGGPDSQLVKQKYQIDFQTVISSYGFVVVIVDGRGTGFKGRKYRSAVSMNLGKFEVDDQIAAAR